MAKFYWSVNKLKNVHFALGSFKRAKLDTCHNSQSDKAPISRYFLFPDPALYIYMQEYIISIRIRSENGFPSAKYLIAIRIHTVSTLVHWLLLIATHKYDKRWTARHYFARTGHIIWQTHHQGNTVRLKTAYWMTASHPAEYHWMIIVRSIPWKLQLWQSASDRAHIPLSLHRYDSNCVAHRWNSNVLVRWILNKLVGGRHNCNRSDAIKYAKCDDNAKIVEDGIP